MTDSRRNTAADLNDLIRVCGLLGTADDELRKARKAAADARLRGDNAAADVLDADVRRLVVAVVDLVRLKHELGKRFRPDPIADLFNRAVDEYSGRLE